MPDVQNHHDYDKDANAECPDHRVIRTLARPKNMANTNGARAWDIFLKFVAVTILPWMTFVTLMLFSIDKRVAVIESNRFDTRDGMNMMKLIAEKADAKDVPPSWLIKRIDRLEKDLEEVR